MTAPSGPPSPGPTPAPPGMLRQIGTLALDIGAPIALYYWLQAAGVSNVLALGIGALVPAIGLLVQLATKRRLDGVGGVVVVTVVATIVLSVITRSPRFLLAKDGLLTALWGLWFLASTRARRPVAFVLARPLMEGRRLLGARSWDEAWDTEPRFRRTWRVASVMWGVGLLIDAVIRVVMSYTLPIPVVPGLGGPCGP